MNAAKEEERFILVVADDSREMDVALAYACRRARATGSRVMLMRVVAGSEAQHWGAVEEIMRAEAREKAERDLDRLSDSVNEASGALPVLQLREGNLEEEVFKLVEEEPRIRLLVLAAASGKAEPGKLIKKIAGGGIDTLRLPVTIVPGHLSEDALNAIA